MSTIRPIRNDDDLRAAEAELERLWGIDHPPEGTPESDTIEVLAVLIDEYERRNHPLPEVDPIAAIQVRMQEKSLTRKDLEAMIGSRGRVSEVLSGKRGLSIEMVRRLHRALDIPLETLVQPNRPNIRPEIIYELEEDVSRKMLTDLREAVGPDVGISGAPGARYLKIEADSRDDLEDIEPLVLRVLNGAIADRRTVAW